jgi:hypothetical protein
MKKYKHEFMVVPTSESQDTLDYVNRILKEEREIEFAAKPLETSHFQVENIKCDYVFYKYGLGVNVMQQPIKIQTPARHLRYWLEWRMVW